LNIFAFFSRFSVILLTAFPLAGIAGEIINQKLSVELTSTIFIDIPRGKINVIGWDKAEVVVQGELDDASKQLTFNSQEEKTLIKVAVADKKYWGDASELSIFMPKGSRLRFKGIDTDFNISKLINRAEGKTISGDLTVTKSEGDFALSVVSGNIKLSDSSGLAKLESVSGMLDFSGDFKNVYIRTMSGDIEADISGTDKLILQNVSGQTNVTGLVKNHAQIKLTSVSGNIFFSADKNLNAECMLVSQFGGNIDNQLTDDVPTEASLHKKSLNFISGDGSGSLSMSTVTGAITIKKNKS
jgi:DUF4097 and DUF4098 domain-containing protein YvlB